MKKILILVMSCNQDLFKHQETYIKQIYAKDILDKKYDNIDFWIYTASDDNKYHVNKQEHKLYVPCDDSLNGTYEKTYKTLCLIKQLGFEYDYILRTNLSTYINVKLLDRFVNEIDLNNKIYSYFIYCTYNACGPYNWCLYAGGNGLLLSKYWVNVLINTPLSKVKHMNTVNNDEEVFFKIDDNTIGYIINCYGILNNMDIDDIWHSLNDTDKDIYKHIIIPFRIYNDDRSNEEYLAYSIHNAIEYYQDEILKYDINIIIDKDHLFMGNFEKSGNRFKMLYRKEFDKENLIKQYNKGSY